MQGVFLSKLLALPVRVRGIQLGRPVDALLDRVADRVVGLELACGDGKRRFLPFAVADVREDEIAVASALALLEERDLAFYRSRTRTARELSIADPWVDEQGRLGEERTAA